MQDKSDAQLLREYANLGSEAAFGELVARHTDLVYSAALRQMESSDLARDVAQSVFTDLARKARSLAGKLADDASLVGWLYRGTRFAALTLLRDDRRRQYRERQAMQQLDSAPEASSDWDRVRPVLDDAMADLSDEDRDALLLRFFKNQEFRSVGAALGVSDDAAQKRVTRALDKLRTELTRRGVTTTTAALAAALAVNAVPIAPSGLAGALANASLAGATASVASTSALEMLTMMTSMKTTTILATLAVLLVVGGGGVKFYQANARSNAAPVSSAAAAAKSAIPPGTTRPPVRGRAPIAAATQTENERALAVALARISEVLNDPKATRRFPHPDMQEALAALGDQRATAIPVLRAGLKSPNGAVRSRAADGLGLLGAEARDAAPDLVDMLRSSTSLGDAGMSAGALRRIGPLPEIVSDLVQILKDNPNTRLELANALPDVAGRDTKLLEQTLKPLLQDGTLDVRGTAASVLAGLRRDQAGSEVLKVVAELLQSGDDRFQRVSGLSALQNMGSDPTSREGRVTAGRLGPGVDAAIPGLVDIAMNSQREDLRSQALRLLDGLAPDLRQQYPEMDSLLKNQEQATALAGKARSGQLSLAEMIDGLEQYPKAGPAIADALARLGTGAQPALRALGDALVALEPQPNASGMDRSMAYRAREAVANAMQQIAPDQPKPLFTENDMRTMMDFLRDPELRADQSRSQNISAAIRPVLAGAPGQGIELTPEQMRQLLNALKGADQPAYHAVAAQVRKIDPNFFSKPAR